MVVLTSTTSHKPFCKITFSGIPCTQVSIQIKGTTGISTTTDSFIYKDVRTLSLLTRVYHWQIACVCNTSICLQYFNISTKVHRLGINDCNVYQGMVQPHTDVSIQHLQEAACFTKDDL